MLWHRTQDRGSSPLPTHSEYLNSKQHAARLTKKREQGMFIDRCSGVRGIVSPCSLDKALRVPPPTPEHLSVRMFRELKK
ncbi:hypothetical protein ALC57_01750 [Trachymyrmex cornetzi]|uniref:Uncharacterized protein n=1 Tax=Trachymyrmex cornetzi TaxID=471704 RepID=A0A195ELH9_9HYME|nr:hypothetical protein ALC57_01750 [Trachymyrmex cornetzi]